MADLISANKFWNKVGNDSELFSSERGPNGIKIGSPSYLPCKFNNGLYSNIGAYFPAFPEIQNKGMLEVWGKSVGWSCTDGKPSDINIHWVWELWFDNWHKIQLVFWTTHVQLVIYNVDPNFWSVTATTGITFADGELWYFLAVWDRANGLSGGDSIRLYFGDTLVGSSNAVITPDASTPWTLYFLTNGFLTLPLIGVGDNPKAYDDATDDLIVAALANKDNEGDPPVGGFKMIGGGLKSPMLEGVIIA